MEFDITVRSVTHEKWDWLVTVIREDNGKYRNEWVSGGFVIVDNVINRLKKELENA